MEGWGALKEGILSDLPSISNFRFGAGREQPRRTLLQSCDLPGELETDASAQAAGLAAKTCCDDGGRGIVSRRVPGFIRAFLSVCDGRAGDPAFVRESETNAVLRGDGIWLYLLAKKGGEAFFHRHAGGKAEKIRNWVEQNGFLSIFIPSILPPPLPFKAFVLAEGVFQVPLRTFVTAVLLGRGLRYGAEGILAVVYGDAALDFLIAHSRSFSNSGVGVLVVLYIATHLTFRDSASKK